MGFDGGHNNKSTNKIQLFLLIFLTMGFTMSALSSSSNSRSIVYTPKCVQ